MSWDTETADKCKLPELDPKLCDDCRCYAYCYRQMKMEEMEEQMSVSKWAYIPSRCDGDYCPGDCDNCAKWDLCPPGHDANDCANDAEMCEICWETFRAE